MCPAINWLARHTRLCRDFAAERYERCDDAKFVSLRGDPPPFPAPLDPTFPGSMYRRLFGPDVWQFRCSEKDTSIRLIYRKRVIGTVQQYPDAQAARDVTTGLVRNIDSGTSGCKVTVEQICEHFEQRELRSGDSFRNFSTIKTYRGYIRKWIKPRWGSRYLDEIKAVDVEAWLRRLRLPLRTI
jgi:hypothetical protein